MCAAYRFAVSDDAQPLRPKSEDVVRWPRCAAPQNVLGRAATLQAATRSDGTRRLTTHSNCNNSRNATKAEHRIKSARVVPVTETYPWTTAADWHGEQQAREGECHDATVRPSVRRDCHRLTVDKHPKGIAVHRPLVIGSTATPLTPSEKLLADPNHTHKWTIAVRSAASNPLPTHALDERGLPKAQPANPAPSTHGAAAGTRGRDTETDYHRHVGGKDDISHFIRRVQFKLHESFPAPLRTIDKPPFQVTETGWGEFDVIIKIWWVAEASEKFLQTMHWLKLHPWPNMPLPTTPAPPLIEPSNGQVKESVANDIADSAMTDAAEEETKTASATTQASTEDAKAVEQPSEAASVTATTAAGASDLGSTAAPPQEPAVAAAVPPAPPMAPVVHSWQYDEVVFPDPTEAFYQTLLSHPPTP